MSKNDRIQTALESESIPKIILKLGLPNALGLLSVAAYSLADSFFVSSLGVNATAAVGVTFSLHVILQAVGYTLGMGAGSLLSRAMGKGEYETGARYAGSAILFSAAGGALITLIGLFFTDSLLRLLGAEGEVLTMARAYTLPFLWAAIPMCISLVLSQLLRAEGRAWHASLGLVAGSLCNILLDPLLIPRMGIAGASTATLCSQLLSIAVLTSAYFEKERLFTPKFKFSFQEGAHVLYTGLPSLFRQGFSGMAAILLNRAAASLGTDAVAGMSLVSRIFLLVFSLALGIGQGMMPVVGFCMGRGKTERMRRAFAFSLWAASGVMLAISLPLFFFADGIFALFGESGAAAEIGTIALRAQSAAMVTHGVVTPTILYLQAIGRPIQGTVLASARQGIFFLPLVFLLPTLWGVWGLALTQPLADLLSLGFALPFLFLTKRKLRQVA